MLETDLQKVDRNMTREGELYSSFLLIFLLDSFPKSYYDLKYCICLNFKHFNNNNIE